MAVTLLSLMGQVHALAKPSGGESLRANLFWVDARDDCIPLFTLTDRVVIYTELLGDQMHYSSLLWRKRPGECKLVSHVIVLEKQDTRVDLQRRWVIEIQLI